MVRPIFLSCGILLAVPLVVAFVSGAHAQNDSFLSNNGTFKQPESFANTWTAPQTFNGGVTFGTVPSLPLTQFHFYTGNGSNLAADSTLSAGIDGAIGSTRGSILERGASGWLTAPPGTSGLPWVSNGTGADPAYQALTGGGIASNTIANSNLASMPANTVKGSVGGGAPSDLTVAQVQGFIKGIAVSVTDPAFGAKCDGSTDDATAFNNAIAAVNSAGGGVVSVPTGTCVVGSPVVMKTTVTLQGNGRTATVIQGKNATTGAIIQTLNFATLTGTNTVGGPFKWGLRDITIDGNKANRASGDNFDIYAYDYILFNVDSRNAPGAGIYSEWSTSTATPVASGGDGMEAILMNVRSFAAGANGITWNGPHDSRFVDVLSFNNVGFGIDFGTSANFSCQGTTLTHVHIYGSGNWGMRLNCTIFAAGVTTENNASGGGIQVNASGGLLLASRVDTFANVGPGIQLNTSGSFISTLQSRNNTGASGHGIQFLGNNNAVTAVNVSNNAQSGISLGATAGNILSGVEAITNLHSVDFTGSLGANRLEVINFQTSGSSFASGPNITDRVELITTGGATGGDLHQYPGHFFSSGTVPSLTAGCNGTGSSVAGTDVAGTVTGQTAAATTCTLTFATAYVATPNCVVTPLNFASFATPFVVPAQATITVTFGSLASAKWSYNCNGT
jgi:hypothetical protein